jgi:iron complex outermembrane receptor protein
MKGLRLSAKRDLDIGPLTSFEGGVNFTNRSKETARSQQLYALKNGTPCVNSTDVCTPFPAGVLQSPINMGFVGIPSLVSFDTMTALNSGAYNNYTVNLSNSPDRNWIVKEKVTTAFAKMGLEFSAGIPVHGNVGMQLVRTQQSSGGVGWDANTSQVVPGLSTSKSYNDFLPSLNLTGELNSSTYVRFGAAKTLARPNMVDMRGGMTASLNSPTAPDGAANQWAGSGGNPNLEPWRATALDLSIEKYFSKRTYVAAAVFEKKLKNSIYVDTTIFDFSGFPNSSSPHQNPACLVGQTNCNLGILSAPTNGPGGYVQGAELSGALDFGLLSKTLDGFGTTLTYSHTHSSIAGHANNGQIDITRTLEGLSGDVYALTAYYEKDGWSARVGGRYRSAYIAQVRGVWINTSLVANQSELITDAQLGYAWESGPLKGLSVDFQIANLGNTPYRTSLNDDSYSTVNGGFLLLPSSYQQYGRRYLFGVGYKF